MNSRHIRNSISFLILTAAALPLVAQAYVGPGAGLGLLTALWGLLAAVGVAVFYVVMWPIRRMRRRRKAERLAAAAPPSGTAQPIVKPESNRDSTHS